MVYDSSTGAADAVPLGELLRELLTGDSRAADGAPAFLRQYDPTAPNGIARPIELANSVLQGAFQPTAAPSLAQPAGPAAIATATPTPTPTDKCYGDEQISFAPEEPRVGIELLIAVTSAHPHPYSRLYGTESTTFSRERPGQLGTVWEYTVYPTLVGKHEYTFYVDGTIPCVSASVRVSGLPTTSTPRPTRDRTTATPYPTAWFPTPTTTPTATSATRP